MYYSTTDGVGNPMGDLFGLGCSLLICVFVLATIAFQIWMIVDAAKKVYPKDKENEKIIWILVILFTGIIGSLVYYFVQKPKYQELQPAVSSKPSSSSNSDKLDSSSNDTNSSEAKSDSTSSGE